MKIFLSYNNKDREIAERLALSLRSQGHHVFYDKTNLPAGESYDDRIQSAIDNSQLFIFLLSPDSINKGSYARSELKFAQQKWPVANGKVLPVVVRSFDYAKLPAYLSTVTVLDPEGSLVAETLSQVAILAKSGISTYLKYIAVVVVFAVLVIAIGFYKPMGGEKLPVPSKPRIIMVTPTIPNNQFGILHRNGLRTSLEETRFGVPYVIGGRLSDFKNNNLTAQLKELEQELAKGDVVSVIAPSVTEATASVIEKVAQLQPEIPVFVESSINWLSLQRFNQQISLFRLSSSLAEKAKNLNRLLKEIQGNGQEVYVYLEEVNNTVSYGDQLLSKVLSQKNGVVIGPGQRIRFPFGDPGQPQQTLPLDNPNAVIVFLGISQDLKRFIGQYYKRTDTTQARLISLLSAHMLPKLLQAKAYKSELIFDLTDLDVDNENEIDSKLLPYYQFYTSKWGQIKPTHRDQAFSFDIGLLLDGALDTFLTADSYQDGLENFTKALTTSQRIGITGRIGFEQVGEGMEHAWQNKQSQLDMLNYNPSNTDINQWQPANIRSWQSSDQ